LCEMSRHDILTEIELLTDYGLTLRHQTWQYRAIIERIKFLRNVLSGSKVNVHVKWISDKYTNKKIRVVDKFGVEYESVKQAADKTGINISVLRKDINQNSERF